MKLIELLEQGKKATCPKLKYRYIYKNYKNEIIAYYKDKKETVVELEYNMFINDTWEEYKEELLNINPNINDKVYYISDTGTVENVVFKNDFIDNKVMNNFNLFDNEEFAYFVNKKQKLERAMIMYSYLNGANEIDWNNYNIKKYYIDTEVLSTGNKAYIDYIWKSKTIDTIYFNTKEVANKCLELYRDEIEEVMNLSLKFKM